MTTRKLLGSLRMKIRVALASLAVLLAGAALAPRSAPTALSPSQERALPLLEEQRQTRPVLQGFAGIQDAAARIADEVVAIPAATAPTQHTSIDFRASDNTQPPSGFGIVVSADGRVLTHERALRGRTKLRIRAMGTQPLDAQVVGYEPDTGLALLSASFADAALKTPTFAAPPEAGALAVAFFREDDQETVIPVFITSVSPARYSIASMGAVLRPGTPIYNLAGELLAVATGSPDRPAAVPVGDAVSRMRAPVAGGTGMPASIGVIFQPLTGEIVKHFGATGALVSDIVAGGPASDAGIRPGDVLLAIGEDVVNSPEAARQTIVSLPLDSPLTVRARRDAQTITHTVTPTSAVVIAGSAGNANPPAGVLLESLDVFAASALAAAGIPPHSHVITINGHAISSPDDALRTLRRSALPALLYVQGENGERFFAVVGPRS